MTRRVVDRSLFSDVDEPCLRGSRCVQCHTTVFPAQRSCPRCSAGDTSDVDLPRTGVLWSWTVQQHEPKTPFRRPPGAFAPYPVGYVDLGDVIVESRLQLPDGVTPVIGMPVTLTLVPAWDDVDTFAFRLAQDAAGSGT